MSSRSFVIQYVIKAKDLYSKAALASKKATDQMKSSVASMRKEFAISAVKINKNSNHISRSIKKSKIAFQRAARGMKASMEKMEAAYGKTVRSIRTKALVVSAVVGTAFVMMTRSMKNASRDASETRSKFATVFQDINSEAQNTAKTLASSYGLARSEAQALLANTGDLLTGFGFSQGQSLDISNKVQQLAVDLASFTNYAGGAEGASMALTKALLGERESIKSLGISIMEKDVNAKIRKMMAEGATFATMRQAKAQATLALAYEQSKNAVGDFAKTREQLANQERISDKAFQNMWEGFGEILEPIFLKITQLKIQFYNFLDGLSPRVKKVLLIFAAVLAALGPIVVLITTLMLTLPLLKLAFLTFAPVVIAAITPLLPLLTVLALAATVIYLKWNDLKIFFKDFFSSFEKASNGSIGRLLDSLNKLGYAIINLFGSGSQSKKAITDLNSDWIDFGKVLGDTVGTLVNNIAETITFIATLITELMELLTTFDFSNFNLPFPDYKVPDFLGGITTSDIGNYIADGYQLGKDKISAFKFDWFGSNSEVLKKATINQVAIQKAASNVIGGDFKNKTSSLISANSSHKVDVNVGLDRGLKATTPVKVSTSQPPKFNTGGNL